MEEIVREIRRIKSKHKPTAVSNLNAHFTSSAEILSKPNGYRKIFWSKFTLFFRKKHKKKNHENGKVSLKGATLLEANRGGFLFLRSYNGCKVLIPVSRTSGTQVWGPLSPIIMSKKACELFVRGNRVFVTYGKLGRIAVEVNVDVEKIIARIVAKTGVILDYSNPRADAEINGWRVYMKLPIISGEAELTATRVATVPRLDRIVHPLLALRLVALALRPSVMAIVGPPGSGKTTLLNALLNEISRLYPQLRMCIIEAVRELTVEGTLVSRSIASRGVSLTDLIRQSVRYERPDILVVGELRGEEIWSWVEAGRSGIAALATYHSPSVVKAVRSMADLMQQSIRNVTVTTVLQYIDVFVVMSRYLDEGGFKRRISAVYISDGQRLVPVYADGVFNREEIFERFMPTLTLVGPYSKLTERLRKEYGIGREGATYSELRPLTL